MAKMPFCFPQKELIFPLGGRKLLLGQRKESNPDHIISQLYFIIIYILLSVMNTFYLKELQYNVCLSCMCVRVCVCLACVSGRSQSFRLQQADTTVTYIDTIHSVIFYYHSTDAVTV